MPTEIVPYSNEQEWLAERMKDVTSTEVAALPGIDVSPYLSPWQLFMHKSGRIPVEFEPNERMKWGSRLQDAIAKGAAEEMGMELLVGRLTQYMRIPEHRVGSSFDYKIWTEDPGLMEVKNVDSIQFQNNWREEDGVIEAPPHIELQVQHQLLVSGMSHAYIVALVGGNRLVITRRKTDPDVHRVILKRVAEFWKMVDDGVAPAPDFTRDARLISALYNRSTPGEVIDLTDRTDIDELVWHYTEHRKSVESHQNRVEEYKARLLEQIGTAEKAVGKLWTISAGEIQPSKGVLITPEMVGTYVNPRKGYRRFMVAMKQEVNNQ